MPFVGFGAGQNTTKMGPVGGRMGPFCRRRRFPDSTGKVQNDFDYAVLRFAGDHLFASPEPGYAVSLAGGIGRRAIQRDLQAGFLVRRQRKSEAQHPDRIARV